MEAWKNVPANIPDGDVAPLVDPADNGIVVPKEGVSATGVTTLGRVMYVVLFLSMWGLMAFPIIFDIIAVTSHLVLTLTPQANNQDEILNSTLHPEFYRENIYDKSLSPEDFAAIEWNAWTIWNIVQLIISVPTFIFYIYIAVAVVIGGLEGFGDYDPKNSILNEPWNMWIFFALNSILFLTSILKFWGIMISLEKFVQFDEEQEILYWWNELKFIIWDPEQRLELEIEGYAELVKVVVIIANYFVYW